MHGTCQACGYRHPILKNGLIASHYVYQGKKSRCAGSRKPARDPYMTWCDQNETSHGHCPLGCEHPQPFGSDGRLFCGKCWHDTGTLTEMVPCNEGIC